MTVIKRGVRASAGSNPALAIWRRKNMTSNDLKIDIIEKAEIIAKSLKAGKDVEIRKTANGISVTEIAKKVVSR